MSEKTLFQELVDGLSEEEIYEIEQFKNDVAHLGQEFELRDRISNA